MKPPSSVKTKKSSDLTGLGTPLSKTARLCANDCPCLRGFWILCQELINASLLRHVKMQRSEDSSMWRAGLASGGSPFLLPPPSPPFPPFSLFLSAPILFRPSPSPFRSLSRWTRPLECSFEGEFQLGHQAALQRYCANSWIRAARCVGDSREPPRRMGKRCAKIRLPGRSRCLKKLARLGRACQTGLAAQTHHCLLCVGRGGADVAGFHGMGGSSR